MDVKVFADVNLLARAAADEIEEVIKEKPEALICLCAGSSPVPVMQQLVTDARMGLFPAGSFRFVSLDEWVGLGIDDAGSCIHDVSEYFLDPLGLEPGERMFFFDGLSEDLDGECMKAADFIEKNGGIDVILLGVGMNGHIGFNEPPACETDGVRVVELSDTSKTVSVKYFKQEHDLKHGITIGMPQIMGAKKIIVIAFGAHKQDVVCRTVLEEKNGEFPVTLLRAHPNIIMYFDQKAAQKLSAGRCK